MYKSTKFDGRNRIVVLIQLDDQLFPTSEDPRSNPVIERFLLNIYLR